MGKYTKIAWCDHTFNPVVGCEKISPGCDNCYAEAWAKRAGTPELWNGSRRKTKTWGEPVKWDKEAKAKGIRYKVFCASLADVFDNKWEPEWRTDLWKLIKETPALDWIIVTKRIGNVKKMLPSDWGDEGYHNVTLLITVVDQLEFDRDFMKLAAIPAFARGLSVEPQLGPINLSLMGTMPKDITGSAYRLGYQYLDWVISGAESGAGARDFDDNWARNLRDQCQEFDVPFFFKQHIRDGKKIETPELDGKRWIQFPYIMEQGE